MEIRPKLSVIPDKNGLGPSLRTQTVPTKLNRKYVGKKTNTMIE